MSQRQKVLLGRGLMASAAAVALVLLVGFYAVVSGAVEHSRSLHVATAKVSAAD